MGDFAMPEFYTEVKKRPSGDGTAATRVATIDKGWQEFAELTGRKYQAVETYKTEGAEILMLSMGALGETASVAVDRMQDQGLPGLALRLWRPFPSDDLRKACGGAKKIVVMDRAISFGAAANPVAAEVSSLLYDTEPRPCIFNSALGSEAGMCGWRIFAAIVKRPCRDTAPRGLSTWRRTSC